MPQPNQYYVADQIIDEIIFHDYYNTFRPPQ